MITKDFKTAVQIKDLTIGDVIYVTSRDAQRIGTKGKRIPYDINSATGAKKTNLEKMAKSGVTEYIEITFQGSVITVNSEQAIEIFEKKQQGEVELKLTKKATDKKASQFQFLSVIDKVTAKEFRDEDAKAKWLDLDTYTKNPELLSNLGNIQKTVASMEQVAEASA